MYVCMYIYIYPQIYITCMHCGRCTAARVSLFHPQTKTNYEDKFCKRIPRRRIIAPRRQTNSEDELPEDELPPPEDEFLPEDKFRRRIPRRRMAPRRRITPPKTNSEDEFPEDELFPEDGLLPEDKFRRRIP